MNKASPYKAADERKVCVTPLETSYFFIRWVLRPTPNLPSRCPSWALADRCSSMALPGIANPFRGLGRLLSALWAI